MNLVLDFDFVEQGAERGVPRYMEWYGAFGLLVTLVWLYLEILRLLAKLQDTSDGDGTLLDHMTVMYGAGMADSNSHSPIDIPMILAGSGAGHLKGGRHIRFKNTPLANLHLTLLDQFGVNVERIGDSTGRVDARILAL